MTDVGVRGRVETEGASKRKEYGADREGVSH